MIKMGTVLSLEGDRACVFTMDSRFVTIKRRGLIVGEQVHFSSRELVRDKNPLKYFGRAAAAVAVAAAVFFTVLCIPGLRGSLFSKAVKPAAAVVSVDINPSVQMSVDGDCNVISAQSFNSDGTSVLKTLTLKGLTLKEAVDKIVGASRKMGFLSDKNNIVLVSAALEDAKLSNGSACQSRLKALLEELQSSGSADTIALYIENQNVRAAAQKNNLSIGRELLYEFARQKSAGLTLEDIRGGKIGDLLCRLDASGDSLTDSLDPGALSVFTPCLKASCAGGKISFAWNTVQSDTVTNGSTAYSGFKYYKVVASASPHPKYPQNGYIAVFTDKSCGSWSFDPASDGYNKSPALEPGQSYYFSITYVFENGSLYADDVRLTIPNTPAHSPSSQESSSDSPHSFDTLSPGMNASAHSGDITVTWNAIPGATVNYGGQTYTGFKYYKIVASAENPHPKYPDDGWLNYITDSGCTSWSFDTNSDGYNKSPALTPGQSYYFSVTYVFENGKIAANAVRVTIPKSASQGGASGTAFNPAMNAVVQGGNIKVNWNTIPGSTVSYGGKTYSGFKFYKIVASADNPRPKYPEDGWLNFITDSGCSSWSFNPSSGGYNQSPQLVSGQYYYITVTYVFSDSSGNNVYLPATNVVRIKIP